MMMMSKLVSAMWGFSQDRPASNRAHPGALHLLGIALLSQQRAQDALAPLQEAAAASADSAIETHLAAALRHIGQQAAALAVLERATARQPPFAPAYLELGLLLRKQRRFGDAEAVLK